MHGRLPLPLQTARAAARSHERLHCALSSHARPWVRPHRGRRGPRTVALVGAEALQVVVAGGPAIPLLREGTPERLGSHNRRGRAMP